MCTYRPYNAFWFNHFTFLHIITMTWSARPSPTVVRQRNVYPIDIPGSTYAKVKFSVYPYSRSIVSGVLWPCVRKVSYSAKTHARVASNWIIACFFFPIVVILVCILGGYSCSHQYGTRNDIYYHIWCAISYQV